MWLRHRNHVISCLIAMLCTVLSGVLLFQSLLFRRCHLTVCGNDTKPIPQGPCMVRCAYIYILEIPKCYDINKHLYSADLANRHIRMRPNHVLPYHVDACISLIVACVLFGVF